MDITHRSETRHGTPDLFTGTVFFEMIAMTEDPHGLQAVKVHFTPGSRTAWHCHPVGQVLHVLDGVGRVQERGDAGPSEIRSGDSVVSTPGVWHWHGAAPENSLIQLAVQVNDPNLPAHDWGEHVSDADYLAEAGNC